MPHWKASINCPYCGETSPNESCGDDGITEWDCDKCGKRYKLRQYTDVHTYTAKMPQPKKGNAAVT